MDFTSKTVTVRTIAAACGYGKATVSRALSGHPNVSDKAREVVLETAARLGYRPDPALAVLSRRRWPSGAKPSSVTLAWVDYQPGPEVDPFSIVEHDGARTRALELGYQFEVFNLRDFSSGNALSRVLFSRGIQGVLIRAFKQALDFDFDWNRFSTVFVGPENDEIHVHNVQSDFRGSVKLALHECLARGYKRIGFALMDFHASGTNEPILAQTVLEHTRLTKRLGPQPPIHQFANRPELVPPFLRWFDKEQPDVIIASHPVIYDWLAGASFYVKSRRDIRVPEDVALVSLRLSVNHPEITAIDLRYYNQGREAVNLVHSHLKNGVIGAPIIPLRISIPPVFAEGTTLPVKTPIPGKARKAGRKRGA